MREYNLQVCKHTEYVNAETMTREWKVRDRFVRKTSDNREEYLWLEMVADVNKGVYDITVTTFNDCFPLNSVPFGTKRTFLSQAFSEFEHTDDYLIASFVDPFGEKICLKIHEDIQHGVYEHLTF